MINNDEILEEQEEEYKAIYENWIATERFLKDIGKKTGSDMKKKLQS